MFKDRSTMLTKGPIMRTLLFFALPIMFGNLFQQLYNAVDSLVVGNFVDSTALAAVTSTNNVIFLTVGFLQGVFIGAGVVIARYFGAENELKLREAIHTNVLFALFSGVVLSVLGVLMSPWLLRHINTPPEVLPLSILYFKIYYSGIVSVVLYNCANGILQAVGDSRHPLIYLIISSILNIILDLVFVVFFKWGVAGVAYATVISQTVSALLAFIRLASVPSIYRVSLKHMKCNFSMLKSILVLGLPSGIQNSIIAFSNLVSQSHMNSFGAYAVAGSGSFLRVEGFSFIVITSIALATTTYISQNIGAGLIARAKKASIKSAVFTTILGECMSAIVLIFAVQFIGMFNGEPEVIRFGVLQAKTVALWYFLPAITHSMAAALRGIGKTFTPMVVILVCWCAVRVTYLTIVMRICHDFRLLVAVYPITWFLSAVTLIMCYRSIKWEQLCQPK